MNYYDILLAKKLEDDRDPQIVGLSVTENGTYSEEGKVYKPVVVNVPLGSKSVTANGVYNAASDNLKGYSSVDVNVEGYKISEVSGLPSPIATFTDGSALPMPKLKVAVEPQQEGSGDPSPENIRPISGWSAVDVTKAGKNLFGGSFNEHFPIHFNEDKVVIASADVPSEGTNPVQIAYYDKNKTLIDYWGLSTQYSAINNRVARSFTLPKESYYLRYITQSSANYQIEFGETNSVYEPYNGQTYIIDLDGTRYGGTLDVVSGVLTLTDGFISSYNGETLPSTWISDRDVYAEGTTPTIGAEVCYELATPTTIQLTPTAVSSLLGQNNLWADTGDVIEGSYWEEL